MGGRVFARRLVNAEADETTKFFFSFFGKEDNAPVLSVIIQKNNMKLLHWQKFYYLVLNIYLPLFFSIKKHMMSLS
jgi:hypothetical protein